MANIQHKDIPDAQLHEPKGVVTAANKTVYISTGTGTGGWRRIKETDIDFSNPSNNLFGWNDIADNLYTAGSPLTINANTRTKLPNNALGVQSNQTRLGSIWDSSSKVFNINDLNATYMLRVAMKITTAAAAGTPYAFKIELESSNGPLIISAQDLFVKGGGYVNDRSSTIPFYLGSYVNNYPLSVYITCDATINVYNIGFFIQRLYKES